MRVFRILLRFRMTAIEMDRKLTKVTVRGIEGVCFGAGIIAYLHSLGFWAWQFFVDLAVALISIVLSLIVKKREVVFLVVGFYFTSEGVYYVYFASPLGPGFEGGFLNFLLGFCVFGLPLGFLSLTIFSVWRWGRGDRHLFEVAQFGICVGLHVLNLALVMLGPLNLGTRLGAALLATVFGVYNLFKIKTSISRIGRTRVTC